MYKKEKKDKKEKIVKKELTQQQKIFVNEILKGSSRKEAFVKAYPLTINWKDNTINARAYAMMQNPTIKAQLDKANKRERIKAQWTRERALEEINYILDINRKDIDRISQAYDEDISLQLAKLESLGTRLETEDLDDKERADIEKSIELAANKIISLKKQRRVNSVNINGILNAAKVLNRMFGYDITRVEVEAVDLDREKLKQLTVEELKALAYNNDNTRVENED